MSKRKVAHARLSIRLTPQLRDALEELAGYGIHGQTPPEVARGLIARDIERLIQDGTMEQLKRRASGT
jgi:hypothetical protein